MGKIKIQSERIKQLEEEVTKNEMARIRAQADVFSYVNSHFFYLTMIL